MREWLFWLLGGQAGRPIFWRAYVPGGLVIHRWAQDEDEYCAAIMIQIPGVLEE